tara:strand:- start:272 stop:556 length:285 start_codon:yes stop_codon:yes gene_type:complete
MGDNMEIIKVTENGALHFKLSDGRLGSTYPSGYVRVSAIGYYTGKIRLWQINKVIPEDERSINGISRVLIPNQRDRINFLMEFNNKNCNKYEKN